MIYDKIQKNNLLRFLKFFFSWDIQIIFENIVLALQIPNSNHSLNQTHVVIFWLFLMPLSGQNTITTYRSLKKLTFGFIP